LAEECVAASRQAQFLVTTHSPFFINSLQPNQVRVLFRDEQGYTQVRWAKELRGIPEFIDEGAQLGNLWLEGHFGVGDPLTGEGGSTVENAE
jgi:hypothetical protein